MQKFSESLPGRILTVNLAVLTASALAYLTFLTNRMIIPGVLRWALVMSIGLVAGSAVRVFLPGRGFGFRVFIIFQALLVGLVFLGLISRNDFVSQPELSFQGLAPLGLASVTALFVLSIWRDRLRSGEGQKARPKPRKGSAPISHRRSDAKAKPPQASRPVARSKKTSPVKPSTSILNLSWDRRWKQIQMDLRRWWKHGLPDLTMSKEPSAPKRKEKSAVQVRIRRSPYPATAKISTHPGVRLVGREEHRCPYCLEKVEKNDPRGVTICPICHTYHHSDCWAVTGTCQVPHSCE